MVRNVTFTSLTIALAAVSASCRDTASQRAPKPGAAQAPNAATATSSATTPHAACASAKVQPGSALRWFEDDYPAALACARATGKPLVVDLWAKWCHTCLSMKATVFTDPTMASVKDLAIFVALDTDREANAAVVATLPPAAWPTFYVVDAAGAVRGRWVGAATAAQFVAFVTDNAGPAGAATPTTAGSAAPVSPAALLATGHQAMINKQWDAAHAALTAALTKADATFARKPELVIALLGTLRARHDGAGCLALVQDHLLALPNSSVITDGLLMAQDCVAATASGAPADAATTTRVTQLRTTTIDRLRALTADERAPLSVDDRSDAWMNLRLALVAAGDTAAAKDAALAQRALLDRAAKDAATPLQAATYAWPRAEVYAFLGEPAAVIPSLTALAEALPTEYDPPYRVAWAYLQTGDTANAFTWTARAAKLAYGPRKVRVLSQLAEIAQKRQDLQGERAALTDQLAVLAGLERSERNQATRAAAEARLATLATLAADTTTKTTPPAAQAAH